MIFVSVALETRSEEKACHWLRAARWDQAANFSKGSDLRKRGNAAKSAEAND